MKTYVLNFQGFIIQILEMDIKQMMMDADDDLDDMKDISYIGLYIHISGLIPLQLNLHENLKKHQIKAVMSLNEGVIRTIAEVKSIKYYHFSAEDVPGFNIAQYFDETYDIILYHIRRKEHILIHCSAGQSRSVSIVIAFILRYFKEQLNKKITVNQVLKFIRKKRPSANPNLGFIAQMSKI